MNNDLSRALKKNLKSLPRKLSGVFGVRYSKRREMYIRFRGEEPEIDALLKRKGFIL